MGEKIKSRLAVTDGVSVPKLAYSMIEAANALSVSYATIGRLIARGEIKPVEGLRTHCIPATELNRFLRVR